VTAGSSRLGGGGGGGSGTGFGGEKMALIAGTPVSDLRETGFFEDQNIRESKKRVLLKIFGQ
jgi:hypothetical protein